MKVVCVALGGYMEPGFKVLDQLTLRPINCTLLLGHWKIAAFALAALSPEDRKTFKNVEMPLEMSSIETTGVAKSRVEPCTVEPDPDTEQVLRDIDRILSEEVEAGSAPSVTPAQAHSTSQSRDGL